MVIGPRQRTILQELWRVGRLSRSELHERTGVRPNTVGSDVAALLDAGIIREEAARSTARGRPQVPLEIDPSRRRVLGLAIWPGHVQVSQLNLQGQLVQMADPVMVGDPHQLVPTACELLRQQVNDRAMGVGLSIPGFIDTSAHALLFSSALGPNQRPESLHPIYEAAGKLPIVLENDMHALAARWLLTHQGQQDEDVLLVYFEDGRFGSALLINGRPNRGCITAANELGHTRLPVETEVCFCGYPGCLERICSTPFLNRDPTDRGGDGLVEPGRSVGSRNGTLTERAATFDGTDVAMNRLLDLLSMGLSNAVNFSRVNRLVLVSGLMRHRSFTQALTERIRRQILREMTQRVRIDQWDQPADHTAETAGWLALANIYFEGWDSAAPLVPVE